VSPLERHGSLTWAERGAALLYERGASRVWAWGSLGEGHVLDVHSDVDLAVEGMPLDQVEAIKSELCDRCPCKVDVISVEATDAQVRWFVMRGRLMPRDAPAELPNGVRTPLRDKRLRAVADAIRDAGARRVADLGCGPGRLIELVARDPGVEHVLGVDKDERALATARARLRASLSREQMARVTLAHSLFTYRDPAFARCDTAVAVEVVEHLAPPQLAAFEHVVFGFARPATVVVTTPNAEYNHLFGLTDGERRHRDHRFEWTREQFATWGDAIAERHGYAFRAEPVGAEHPDHGAATQLGRFAAAAV
jgi:2-polyprenyl-3-methyl-5-hydroxy-6-metoxy-1,4-benzoquinol methylase